MGTLHENVIYTNIKALCDSHTPRISISKMCVDLGLSKSLGTKLKENPDKDIKGDTAQLIADYFGVSIDCILGKDEQKEKPTSQMADGLSENKQKLIDFAQSVPEDKVELILRVMQSIVEDRQ